MGGVAASGNRGAGLLISSTMLMILMITSCGTSYAILLCDAFSINSATIKTRGCQNTHRRISNLKPRETTTSLFASNTNGHQEQGGSSSVKKTTPTQQKMQRQATAPIFLFPWSILLKIRTVLPHDNNNNNKDTTNNNSKKLSNNKVRRRWEMPLTSKPFQGVEELQSTVKNCLLALAVYFVIGTGVFPFLESSWTVIDALYFSMTTLTTVGYGDVVISQGSTLSKMFLLCFNIYAVCISVSALGIIAKLALAQEKKIIKQARQRARERFVRLFREEEDEDEEGGEDVDDDRDKDDPEDCTWVDNMYLEKCGDDNEEPQTMMGALWQSLKRHGVNFVALSGLALILRKVEKWSFVDLLYFWNCTATTMGYGDISPQTQIGRLLAVVFIPLSVISLGEVIASCVAHMNARAAAKAEKDFLRREITFDDLDHLDINDDGKVCETDFITFMLMAMQKVDRKTMKDLKKLFKALDAGKTGFIEKEDLILLRQRKRLAKRLRREGRNRKKMYERGYQMIENGETQSASIYDHLEGYKIK